LAESFGLGPFIHQLGPLENECTLRIALSAAASQAPNANSTTITAAVVGHEPPTHAPTHPDKKKL